MAGDNQQFCLRWNNHQSTLISVFDSLLESGTLVDCTLAAEGQYLKAHKVVLSACSPYLEVLLSQHYEKHPIVILKDVKFQELKSMMDYMYRGEVNITQDQLATFLKAAESLQIKGLSESSGGDDARDVGSTTKRQREDPPPRRPVNPHPQARLPHSSGLTIEPRRSIPHSSEMAPASPMKSREGSTSPVARKRRRRRPSTGDDASNAALSDSQLETSNSCDLPPISNQAQSTPISVPSILATPSASNNQPIESDQPLETDALNRFPNTPGGELMVKTKMEPNTDQLIEPKTEYLEDVNNEDSVEDLTLDDDDEMPGPSHADGSNQSFAQWQMSGDRSTDEVFMAAQEAVGAHRDSQVSITLAGSVGNFACSLCYKSYKLKKDVQRHMRFECDLVSQKPNFPCDYCSYVAKRKDKLKQHVSNIHISCAAYPCPHCKYTAKRKDKLKLHINSRHTAQEQFSCPYCDYIARRKDTLKHHLKRHELARPDDFPPDSPSPSMTNGDSKEHAKDFDCSPEFLDFVKVDYGA